MTVLYIVAWNMFIALQLGESYGDNEWLTITVAITFYNRGDSFEYDANISNIYNVLSAVISNCNNQVQGDCWNSAYDQDQLSMNLIIFTRVIALQSASNFLPSTVPLTLSITQVQSYFCYNASATNVYVAVHLHYISVSVIRSISLMRIPELTHIIKTMSSMKPPTQFNSQFHNFTVNLLTCIVRKWPEVNWTWLMHIWAFITTLYLSV